jgi:hypothetical protein
VALVNGDSGADDRERKYIHTFMQPAIGERGECRSGDSKAGAVDEIAGDYAHQTATGKMGG